MIEGRSAVPPRGDITILNYEIVAAHRIALSSPRPSALVVDESHYCKNPRAKRTQAVRRLAAAVQPDGLRLALTGHAGPQPRRGADRAAARDRPPRGLRLGLVVLAAVRPGAQRGAPALAPAQALLRATREGRRAAAAAREAPGRRAGVVDQRGRVPARRARRGRVAALAAAGSLRARVKDRGDAARRAPGAARDAAAPGRARQARRRGRLDPRLPRIGRAAGRVRTPRRGPSGRAGPLPRRTAPGGKRLARGARSVDRRVPSSPAGPS